MGVTSDILIEYPANKKHITGESIKGIVKFHLDKDTVYKKITLSLVEKGYCQWYEYESLYRGRRSQQIRQRKKVGNRYIFEGHETKVVKKINLLDKNANENTTLTAGPYEHTFKIIIPENIPPSMKTDIGEIKYYLVLKFKKPRIFSLNKKFKTNITIYPGIDSSVADKTLSFTIEKTLNKLFSSYKHEIYLKAELDRGYLNPSGERQISYVAANNSKVNISVKTELISKTKYKDDFVAKKYLVDDAKTMREVIYSCTVGIASAPENDISCMFVVIPVAPELCTVRHSKIITREFKLRVTLKLPLPHVNSSVEIPVFVGERIKDIDVEIVEASAPIEKPPPYLETITEKKSTE